MRWELSRRIHPPVLLYGSDYTIARDGAGYVLTGRTETMRCADRAALDEACRRRGVRVVDDAVLQSLGG